MFSATRLILCRALTFCLTVLVLLGVTPVNARAMDVEVIIDDVNYAIPGKIFANRVFVPLQLFSDAIEVDKVNWDRDSGVIFIASGHMEVEMTVGNQQALVNGKPLNMEFAPRLENDLVWVPLRFVAGALGNGVGYDALFKTVHITLPEANDQVINISRYYIPRDVVITWQDKVKWRDKNTSIDIESNEPAGDAESGLTISRIKVISGDKELAMEFNEKPEFISAAGLSAGGDYLAVMAMFHYGYKLYILELECGRHIILNDLLAQATGENVETIHALSWAPDGNRLALSFGHTSESRPAVYDLDKNTFDFPPAEQAYSTARIYWHRDGHALDYINEYPSDEYKLYRCYTGKDGFDLIGAVSRDELMSTPGVNTPIYKNQLLVQQAEQQIYNYFDLSNKFRTGKLSSMDAWDRVVSKGAISNGAVLSPHGRYVAVTRPVESISSDAQKYYVGEVSILEVRATNYPALKDVIVEADVEYVYHYPGQEGKEYWTRYNKTFILLEEGNHLVVDSYRTNSVSSSGVFSLNSGERGKPILTEQN